MELRAAETQRIALRTACVKQPGTLGALRFCQERWPLLRFLACREDASAFALAINSGPDYALSVRTSAGIEHSSASLAELADSLLGADDEMGA